MLNTGYGNKCFFFTVCSNRSKIVYYKDYGDVGVDNKWEGFKRAKLKSYLSHLIVNGNRYIGLPVKKTKKTKNKMGNIN